MKKLAIMMCTACILAGSGVIAAETTGAPNEGIKNPPSKETTHAYNTFALWQLYHKRGRVINDGLSG